MDVKAISPNPRLEIFNRRMLLNNMAQLWNKRKSTQDF